VASLRLRSHVPAQTTHSTKKIYLFFFGTAVEGHICMFITVGPMKAVSGGGEREKGGHVLTDTTVRLYLLINWLVDLSPPQFS